MADGIDRLPVELATELTVAWLRNPHTRVSAEEVPTFLNTVYQKVASLVAGGTSPTTEETAAVYEPAVSVRKSLASKDHIVSMIDGKPYRTLRRHLASNGLTPEDYRQRYRLKADYPMVAESYSEARRAMAKKIGLGRKPSQKVKAEAKADKPKGARAAKAAAQQHLGKSGG